MLTTNNDTVPHHLLDYTGISMLMFVCVYFVRFPRNKYLQYMYLGTVWRETDGFDAGVWYRNVERGWHHFTGHQMNCYFLHIQRFEKSEM